ncbi:MAG: hypothetical protein FWD05_03210 [Oscillospiraceae bacterium]|nr:hypothetical protein [Oscillospiraceae bacterium]
MRKDENGHIVVETVGAFIPFVLLVISILSLVQLTATQARVHSALTQTALTISKYSYVVELTSGGTSVADIDLVHAQLLSQISGEGAHAPPFATPSVAVAWLGDGGVSDTLIRTLMNRFLQEDGMSGHEYLLSAHVLGGIDGLDFTGSVIIDSDENIILTVTYRIAYTFGALPLPLPNPYLTVTQTAMTRAWLGGSGEGYK